MKIRYDCANLSLKKQIKNYGHWPQKETIAQYYFQILFTSITSFLSFFLVQCKICNLIIIKNR